MIIYTFDYSSKQMSIVEGRRYHDLWDNESSLLTSVIFQLIEQSNILIMSHIDTH